MTSDRIVKTILLAATRDRVWPAISDAREFGAWFGVEFDGPFAVGTKLTGRIAPTKVDAEIARLQEPHAGMPFEFVVDRIMPLASIAFRWHPFAIEPNVDYSQEPSTLILFELQDAAGGTLPTITESGFDKLPAARRDAAFAANDGGWSMQTTLIQKYLALHPAK